MDWPWSKQRTCYPEGQDQDESQLTDPNRFMELLVSDLATNHNQTIYELMRLTNHVDECFEKLQTQLTLRQSPEAPEKKLDLTSSLASHNDVQGVISHTDKCFDSLHAEMTQLRSNLQRAPKSGGGNSFIQDEAKYNHLLHILGEHFDGQDNLIRGLLNGSSNPMLPMLTGREGTESTIMSPEPTLISDASFPDIARQAVTPYYMQGSTAKMPKPPAPSSLKQPSFVCISAPTTRTPRGDAMPVDDVEASTEDLKACFRKDLDAHHEMILAALNTRWVPDSKAVCNDKGQRQISEDTPMSVLDLDKVIEDNTSDCDGGDDVEVKVTVSSRAPRNSVQSIAESMLDDTRANFICGKVLHDGDLCESYNVENFYYPTGFCQYVARHEYFINTMFFIIGLNCMYIGVDMDNNNADQLFDADWFFIIMENLFTLAFFFEWAIRILSFRTKANFRKDFWMVFDFIMLMLMVGETWIMAPVSKATGATLPIPTGPLRLLRMARLVRLSRLLKNVPELVTLSKGLVQGVRASAASIFMISLFIYIFAILLHSLLKDEVDLNKALRDEFGTNFERLGDCMWVLLIDGTFMLDGTGNILSALLFEGSFQ